VSATSPLRCALSSPTRSLGSGAQIQGCQSRLKGAQNQTIIGEKSAYVGVISGDAKDVKRLYISLLYRMTKNKTLNPIRVVSKSIIPSWQHTLLLYPAT
jgi:hypothetical protein